VLGALVSTLKSIRKNYLNETKTKEENDKEMDK
jgi:hypothetical protein